MPLFPAVLSLLGGVVAFTVFLLGRAEPRTAPVTFPAAIAAVVVGVVAMRRAKGVRSLSRWVAGGGIGLGLSFLALAILFWSANTGYSGGTESAVLGQMRVLITAEHAYRERLGQGSFCSLACLARPALCVPGYAGAPFLTEPFVSARDYNGYRRTFHPGAVRSEPAAALPEARLATFAYTAVPVKVGRTGTRGFCVDSTGRLCFTVDGSAPAVKDGLCDPGCNDLR